jgi:hypothetical protein
MKQGVHSSDIHLSDYSQLVLHRPSIKITNSTHAPDSLGAIALRAKLAAKVADVEVDASIEWRELSVKNILN